jgi:N,N'-diacetyllegionaminate synthase
MKTIVIAEAGVNHNGDLNLAKNLIEIAAKAGADYVKFQTFRASALATISAEKADYQKNSTDSNESQIEMLKNLELTEKMHEELIAHALLHKISFLSTAFDIQSVDLLHKLGQSIFKVPSGEITNLPLLRHIGSFKKDVILSTGMSTMHEIEDAMEVLQESGTERNRICVLHCTSSYPAPMSDINLSAMLHIREELNVAIGYSDHSLGVEIPIAAVALGAKIIEKHFTLDRKLPGPDHKASLEPEELEMMIFGIRNLELAMGDGIKRVMPSEIANRVVVRKSIVASRAISEGEVFSDKNLTTKRPDKGISPMKWDSVIGTVSKRNYLADELIE